MNKYETHNIENIVRSIAAAHGIRWGYNTHSDAYNYVLSWWKGVVHHRLDLQPINDTLAVTHLTDRYKILSHICYWLYSAIPEIFRLPPTVEFTRMSEIKLDSEKEIKAKVEELLKSIL
jgi:hypothetical protein